jgi:hypothetical protein
MYTFGRGECLLASCERCACMAPHINLSQPAPGSPPNPTHAGAHGELGHSDYETRLDPTHLCLGYQACSVSCME